MAFSGYLEQAQPWDSQPQEGALPSTDLRSPSLIYLPSFGPQAKIGVGPTVHGLAYGSVDVIGAGIDFDGHPIKGPEWTIIALCNPSSAAGPKAIFSQRLGSSPYRQVNLFVNSTTAAASSPGRLAVYGGANAAAGEVFGSQSDLTSVLDGKWHVIGATAYGVTGSYPELWSDGNLLSVTAVGTAFTGLSPYEPSQKTRVSNLADYGGTGFAFTEDIALVVVYPYRLPDAVMRQMRPETIWSLVFAPQQQQVFFGGTTVAPTTFLTLSLSLAIQQAQAMTASLSAAVQAPQSASAVASAAVQAARTAQASLDAAVQTTASAVASLSTAVQASGQQTASINGALQLARSATVALDLAVQAHLSATASVNLQVQAAASATASLNLQIQAGSSASVSLSMAVLQSALSAVGLDLAVLRVGSQTAGISAALQAARSAAAAIDIALQIVRSTTAAIDVVLQAARSSSASVNLQIQDGVSALVGIDLAVQQARTAVAGVQLAIGQSATASASVDAVAMLQRVVSAALGGAVSASRIASAGLSFYVDDGGVIVITGPIRLLAIISQEIAFEATIEQA